MYYKDDFIELRLGLGIKAVRSLTGDVYSLALSRDVDSSFILFSTLSTNNDNTPYPPDGVYRITVTNVTNPGVPYFIHLTVNDLLIADFVRQAENIICNCGCIDEDTNCGSNKKNTYCLKRQRLFNLTSILPYTIKPFSTGNPATNNPYLFKFFQLYFNEILQDKKIELGEEYLNYFLQGTNNINTKLFNSLIINLYYALYYYSKEFLTMELVDKTTNTIIVNNFFNYNTLKSCFRCSTVEKDIETLMLEVIADPCFCTAPEPFPLPAELVAQNVTVIVPSTIVSPDAIFDYPFLIENVLNLNTVPTVQPKFITITSLTDVDNVVRKGSNIVRNFLNFTDSVPTTSTPLSIEKSIAQILPYDYTAVATCYVTDNFGRNTNTFTITFRLQHTAVAPDQDLLVTIDNFTENKTTLDIKNLVVYLTTASTGQGTLITSAIWSIIAVNFSFDSGVVFDPAYGVVATPDGNSASFINMTPGYIYTVQLYTTNNAGQDCTFLLNLEVLG